MNEVYLLHNFITKLSNNFIAKFTEYPNKLIYLLENFITYFIK